MQNTRTDSLVNQRQNWTEQKMIQTLRTVTDFDRIRVAWKFPIYSTVDPLMKMIGNVHVSFVETCSRKVWIIIRKDRLETFTHGCVLFKVAWQDGKARAQLSCYESRHSCSNTKSPSSIV